MARKVTIDVEARFIDNVTDEAKDAAKSFEDIEKAAEDAQKEIDDLGKTKAEPKVDADTSSTEKKLKDVDEKLDKIRKSKTEAKLGTLDKATAVIEKVTSKAKAFGSRTYSALVKIRDSNTLSTLNKMSNSIKSLTQKAWSVAVKIKDTFTAPLTKLKNMLFNVKTLIAGIASAWAATKLIVNPINVADAYSSAKISFSTLLGATEGQQMMDKLDEFAKATPFNTSNVIENAQKMLAMGWDPENIIEDMETLGNAAAATGKLDQGLESIVRAMSQIKTKGKLSTEELNQLAEAGIAAKAMLAEQLGYGTGDSGIAAMTDDLENGRIASDVAIEALIAGMQKYDGMMDSMANETVEGLISQIGDAFNINIVRRWGQGLQDGAKRGMGTLVTLLDDAEEALAKVGDILYELGKTASNWVADKLQVVVDKITEITGTFEFENATLWGKISMLWDGLIVDPLMEWWENGGREKTIETAGKIGSWIGEMLTKGLLAIFGATDVLNDKVGENAGTSVAGSFLQGFLDNFDGKAITDAIVDAISNVWNALPGWAQMLIGGYAVGSLAGGIANFGNGIASFIEGVSTVYGGVKKVIGSFNIASSAFPILTSSGTGIAGLIGKAGVKLGASTTGGALLTGGLGVAGGIAGGISLGKGIFDLYRAHQAYEAGDHVNQDAYAASGWTTIGGVGAGAAIGSIFGPLGTLVGAGIGGIAGWIGGNAWADSIRAADDEINNVTAAMEELESEQEKLDMKNKMVWQNMKDHFGDISLSVSEIQRIVNHTVWGDDIHQYEQLTAAVQGAADSLATFKTASESTRKWMWKAGLGLEFTEDEVESIAASFDDYISSAITHAENKHYEFTAAVSLLVDVESDIGKSIIESGNAFYGTHREELEKLGSELAVKVSEALADGVISTEPITLPDGTIQLSEHDEIINLQQQIAEILQKVADAETAAELELAKVKFDSGNIDKDSFDAFLEQMGITLSERVAANDEAFTTSVASLKLQLADGALTQEEYDKQLQALIDGYTAKVDEIKAQVMDVELEIISDAYQKDLDPHGLGLDVTEKLRTALQNSLAEGIDPIDWTVEDARRFLNTDKLSEDSALAIAEYLSQVANHFDLIETDVDLLAGVGDVVVEDGTADKVEEEVVDYIPGTVEKVLGVDVSADAKIQRGIEILNEDFGIPEEKSAMITFLLTADYDTLSETPIAHYLYKEFGIGLEEGQEIQMELTLDPEITVKERVEILASHFGISDTQAAKILWRLEGDMVVEEMIDIAVSDFGIPKEEAETITLLLTGEKEILEMVDITWLASELGVPEDIAKDIIVRLSGTKSIEERISILGTDLVSDTEVWQTITVNLKTKLGQVIDTVKGFFGGGGSDGEGDGSGYRGGIFGGTSAQGAFARGGLTDNGGIVGGSTRFIRVNEESPEMIIPLSDQRRGRALKLWAQAGNIMGVPGFARGGIIGGTGGSDEGIRFNTYNGKSESAGGRTVHVDVGGVTLEINVNGSDKESIVEAIKAQGGELADYLVGIIAESLEEEFENTPLRGGAA